MIMVDVTVQLCRRTYDNSTLRSTWLTRVQETQAALQDEGLGGRAAS
jgi:hypothetical protein